MTEAEALEILDNECQDPYKVQIALKVARLALKKQIAKKVIVPPCNVCQKKYCEPTCGHVSKSFVDDFKCPTCGSDRVYITEYGVMHDYCPNCGQKLDWSEV